MNQISHESMREAHLAQRQPGTLLMRLFGNMKTQKCVVKAARHAAALSVCVSGNRAFVERVKRYEKACSATRKRISQQARQTCQIFSIAKSATAQFYCSLLKQPTTEGSGPDFCDITVGP